MATMTITIAVQSKGFSWTRTANITGIEVVQNYIVENVSDSQGPNGSTSYSAIAVGCAVNTGRGTIAKARALNPGGGKSVALYAQESMPMIVYNGAGTGFVGGMNASGTATDTPTEDIETFQMQAFIGTPQMNVLLGFKPTS